MDNTFQWNDSLAQEYAIFRLKQHGFLTDESAIEQFKQSKQPKKDWEIQCIQIDGRNCWLQPSGLYKSEIYYAGCSARLLLESRGTIHSVKRLSDNEVFAIGDEVYETITGAKQSWVIKEFSLKDTRCFSIGINIMNFEKVKEPIPLFTKNEVYDGVEILQGQSYAYVPKTTLEWVNVSDGKSTPQPKESFLYFSTKDAAETYILMNKPCLSLQMIIDDWYSWEEKKEQHLSLCSDFYKKDLIYNNPIIKKLKDLVKSKL